MVFNIYWRMSLGFIIGERMASKLFTDHKAIAQHKYAVNEVKKVMRRVPDANPFIPFGEKPNSYIFY